MNLLSDLAQAVGVLNRCQGTPEIHKARMNFVVNLITILELFSRDVFRNRTDDRSFDDSFPLSVILQVASEERERAILFEMVHIRNEIVHEGKTTTLTEEDITSYCSLVKRIVSKLK